MHLDREQLVVATDGRLPREDYSRGSAADEHGPFEWSKFLLGLQVDHLEIGIDHEPHVIIVVVDPDLLPLSVVQFTLTRHLQLTNPAGI